MKKYLIVFLISMVPLIELRGAIPYAVGFGLPVVPSILVAMLGNMLPVPFIFLFAQRVLAWGKDKKYIGGFCRWCLEKGEKGGKKLQAKAGRGLYLALLLFVGVSAGSRRRFWRRRSRPLRYRHPRASRTSCCHGRPRRRHSS